MCLGVIGWCTRAADGVFLPLWDFFFWGGGVKKQTKQTKEDQGAKNIPENTTY